MKIQLNGEIRLIEESKSLFDLLSEINPSNISIAVAVNGEIISKDHYPKTILNDMDIIEVVRPVGGG
jgi:sulfur carrier protein